MDNNPEAPQSRPSPPPSARLRRFLLLQRGQPLTLGGLLLAFGARAPGLLLMLLGLFLIIPKAGLPVGVFVAVGIALIALQMLLGRAGITVPRIMADQALPRKTTRRMLLYSFRGFRWIEKYLKPRMGNVASSAMQPMLAVVMLLLAAFIALPIPFGDMIPGVAVLLIGAGLVIGDGVAIIVGLGAAVLGVAVIFGLASALFFGGKAILG